MMPILELVTRYCAAWNETDSEKRSMLLASCWAENGIYRAPGHEAISRSALSLHIGDFHADDPGAYLKLASGADGHGNAVRFRWTLHKKTGDVVAEGTSFGRFSDDWLFIEVTGFFGPLPALE